MIEKNEMPINSYLIMNSKAKLNNNQKAKLISWFKSLRNFESDKPKKKIIYYLCLGLDLLL